MQRVGCVLFFVLCVFSVFSQSAFGAITLDSQKKDVSGVANQRFYKGDRVRQYVSVSGHRDSDYNSEEYELNLKYLYKSKKLAAMVEFSSEDIRERSRTGIGDFRKRIEDRDLTLEGKFRIMEQNNYAILYHRAIDRKTYTDELNYYSYRQSAAGMGRIFLDGGLELDLSFGYKDLRNEGHSTNLIPSYRFEHKFNKNIRLTQRGFAFLDRDDSVEYEIKTYLTYKMSKSLSFRITHLYQKIYFIDDDEENNRIARKILMGLVFNF